MLFECLHVHVFIKLRGEMSRHLTTAVIVTVVFRDVIDVVKHHTVPVQVFHSLFEAHVKQHGTVKRLGTRLETQSITILNP